MIRKINQRLAVIVCSIIIGVSLFVLTHQSLYQKSVNIKTEIPFAIINVKDFIDHAVLLEVENPVEEGFKAARKAASELAASGYVVIESQDVFDAHESYYVVISKD